MEYELNNPGIVIRQFWKRIGADVSFTILEPRITSRKTVKEDLDQIREEIIVSK